METQRPLLPHSTTGTSHLRHITETHSGEQMSDMAQHSNSNRPLPPH